MTAFRMAGQEYLTPILGYQIMGIDLEACGDPIYCMPTWLGATRVICSLTTRHAASGGNTAWSWRHVMRLGQPCEYFSNGWPHSARAIFHSGSCDYLRRRRRHRLGSITAGSTFADTDSVMSSPISTTRFHSSACGLPCTRSSASWLYNTSHSAN
jgi:hypothetical protein